jgi:hypothetical protein
MSEWDAELAERARARDEAGAATAQRRLLAQQHVTEGRQFLGWAANKLLNLGVPTLHIRVGWAWSTTQLARRGMLRRWAMLEERHYDPIGSWTGWRVRRRCSFHEYERWPEKDSSDAVLLVTRQLYASDLSWPQEDEAERWDLQPAKNCRRV